MELLNSFSLCILMKRSDNFPSKHIYETYYTLTFIRYLIKISEKLSTECYYVILENFKSFHKNRSSQTQQVKRISRANISFNFYHLHSSTSLTKKQIQLYKYQKLEQLALFLFLLSEISFLSILVCSSLLSFVFRLTN